MSSRAPEGCSCRTCTTDSLIKTEVIVGFRQTGVARPGWEGAWEAGKGSVAWIRATGQIGNHWTDGFYHSSKMGDRS